jgi:hypothetical protein
LKTYGPDDTWPEHDDDWWNEVLDAARARGWSLARHSDHSWGSLDCPTNECYVPPIFSTGRGAESVAKNCLKKVKRCPHAVAVQNASIRQVEGHLDAADTFLDAAEHLLARDARRAEIQELLDEADAKVRRSSELIEQDFDLAAWHEDDHARQARETLADTGLSGVDEPAPVVTAAQEQVDQAKDTLGAVSQKHAKRATLETRIEGTKSRIQVTRDQVGLERPDRQE